MVQFRVYNSTGITYKPSRRMRLLVDIVSCELMSINTNQLLSVNAAKEHL